MMLWALGIYVCVCVCTECPRIKWQTQTSQLDIINLVQSRALTKPGGKNKRRWKQRVDEGENCSRGGCHVVVVKTHVHLHSAWALHAGNQPYLHAQRFFKLPHSLNRSLIVSLNINSPSAFGADHYLLPLQHCGRLTSSVSPTCSVSIRPGKPAANILSVLLSVSVLNDWGHASALKRIALKSHQSLLISLLNYFRTALSRAEFPRQGAEETQGPGATLEELLWHHVWSSDHLITGRDSTHRSRRRALSWAPL